MINEKTFYYKNISLKKYFIKYLEINKLINQIFKYFQIYNINPLILTGT